MTLTQIENTSKKKSDARQRSPCRDGLRLPQTSIPGSIPGYGHLPAWMPA